jgi:hypothetical protein
MIKDHLFLLMAYMVIPSRSEWRNNVKTWITFLTLLDLVWTFTLSACTFSFTFLYFINGLSLFVLWSPSCREAYRKIKHSKGCIIDTVVIVDKVLYDNRHSYSRCQNKMIMRILIIKWHMKGFRLVLSMGKPNRNSKR